MRAAMLFLGLLGVSVGVGAEDNAFVGRWALTIPGGGAGWLGITQEDSYLDGSILWGGGSVVPVAHVYVDGDTLYVTRLHEVERKDAAGKTVKKHTVTEVIEARITGNDMQLVQVRPANSGTGVARREFTGKRIPPLPPKPDLSKVQFGAPVQLFNGKDLSGWRLVNPNSKSAWSVENGVLMNNPVQGGGPYGNLRTDQEFEDFNLTLEVNVDKGGNSGIYLRGIYEVQVLESYGKPVDSHNMGAIYSRITPKVAAERAPGEWQTLDITLVDRHVTVILNGQKIIDNEPLLGCTGGALWSDEFRPGPIYFQGDHTAVKYRNLVLRPVVKG